MRELCLLSVLFLLLCCVCVDGAIVSTSLVLRQSIVHPDGAPRLGITINGTMPGPLIVASKFDRLQINVVNSMSLATSVHWHGIKQEGTPFMDGTAMVTQCPIQPSQSFMYDFEVSQTGTYFYHAHLGGQNADGLVGPLIIREPSDPTTFGYADEFVILIQDWFHVDAMTIDLMKSQGYVGTLTMDSALINGQGVYDCTKFSASSASTPFSCTSNSSDPASYTTFSVTPGKKYRLRIICATTTFNFIVSVDGHPLTVIAADGNHITPTTVDFLHMYSGERYDVLIDADQAPGNYWFRAMLPNSSNGVQAIIAYNTVPLDLPVTVAGPQNVTLDLIAATSENEVHLPRPTKTFVIDVAEVVDPLNPGQRWSLNGIVFSHPTQPLFQGYAGTTDSTQMLRLGTEDIVQVVLRNLDDDDPHPFHLHGHTFWVTGMGPNYTTLNQHNLTQRNAIMKDTVTVPKGGWVSLLFEGDNPGYWLFHCHVEWHMPSGMALIFIEDEQNIPDVPTGFPTCYPFTDAETPTALPTFPNCDSLYAPEVSALQGRVIGLAVAFALVAAALLALLVLIYVRSKSTAGDPFTFGKHLSVELD